MNATSLRGVFPEPKTVYKRNFIKENVKHIKQMQGIHQNSGIFEGRSVQNKPMKATVQLNASNKPLQQTRSLPFSKFQKNGRRKLIEIEKTKGEGDRLKLPLTPIESAGKPTDRGVQTEKPENISKLYENGIIVYPSPGVLKVIAAAKGSQSPRKKECGTQLVRSSEKDRGDSGGIVVPNPHNQELSDNLQILEINEKHNYIKENIMATRQKVSKQDSNQDTLKLQNYQKGVVPKYLRDRKEEQKKELEYDPECPEGHVLLPEEERKETLRVLRQSYADRIQELNCMPVRNDTLRMRKRKIAIEEELKKIDEGIKVFQRPKVFVKINA